jgi:hypothetical protein
MPSRYAFALGGAITSDNTPCGFELWIRKGGKLASRWVDLKSNAWQSIEKRLRSCSKKVSDCLRRACEVQLKWPRRLFFGTFSVVGEVCNLAARTTSKLGIKDIRICPRHALFLQFRAPFSFGRK